MFQNLRVLFLIFLYFSVCQARLTEIEIDNLLKCYKENLDRASTLAEKFEIAFRHYPRDLRYKLFIDKKRLLSPKETEKNQPPHLIFDVDEPGYFSSMDNAFNILPKMDGQVNLDLLIKLHDLAIASIPTMRTGIAGGFRYGISKENYIQAFIELFGSKILWYSGLFPFMVSSLPIYDMAPELLDLRRFAFRKIFKSIEYDPMDFLSIVVVSDGVYVKNIANEDLEQFLRAKLEPLINHYYKSISLTTTLNGRLEAIAELLRAFEVGHFFPDGNQRTYAFLLLTKLLIENGIPPAILEDPTMFDGYMTVQNMALSLRQGVFNFLQENHEGQKIFLEQQCVVKDSDYLKTWTQNASDYSPYFGSAIEDITKKIRDFLNTEIAKAISNKMVNAQEEQTGLSPLEMAIYLGSKKDIDRLITEGAPIFPAFKITSIRPQQPNSEIFFAFSLGALDIVKHLLTKKEVEASDSKNIVAIFDEVINKKNYKIPSNKKMSNILVDILDPLLKIIAKQLRIDQKNTLLDWMQDIIDISSWAKVLQLIKNHKVLLPDKYILFFIKILPLNPKAKNISGDLIINILDKAFSLVKGEKNLSSYQFNDLVKLLDDQYFQDLIEMMANNEVKVSD